MLKSGVSGSRESKTVVDVYQADSESGDKCLTADSFQREVSPSWRGDGSDTDAISELENGRSSIGTKPQEVYSRT